MTIWADLVQYFVKTHIQKNSEDSNGGLNPPNLPFWYATAKEWQCQHVCHSCHSHKTRNPFAIRVQRRYRGKMIVKHPHVNWRTSTNPIETTIDMLQLSLRVQMTQGLSADLTVTGIPPCVTREVCGLLLAVIAAGNFWQAQNRWLTTGHCCVGAGMICCGNAVCAEVAGNDFLFKPLYNLCYQQTALVVQNIRKKNRIVKRKRAIEKSV